MSLSARLRRLQKTDSACRLTTFNFHLCVRNMGLQYCPFDTGWSGSFDSTVRNFVLEIIDPVY
jgi:hypothetical protein